MRHQQWFKFTAIACLAMLVVFLLKLFLPQVALGYSFFTPEISTSPTPDLTHITALEPERGKTLIATSKDALEEAGKQFVCFTSQEYPVSQFRGFTPSKIEREVVRRLASSGKLKECVTQNRRNINFVDLNNLFRVIYTTRLLPNNRVIVIVGVGYRSQIPERATFSEGFADFLTTNANNKDLSVRISNNDVNTREFLLLDSKLGLGRLGDIAIESKGKINFPDTLRISGNEASIDTFLNIFHKIDENSFPFFRLNFHGESSDFINSVKKRELASAELTFDGLLMKGIPVYLENRKQKLIENFGIDVNTNSSRNQATLSKKIGVPIGTVAEVIKTIERNLNQKFRDIRNIQAQIEKKPNSSHLKAKLQDAENELKNIMADKIKPLESLYEVKFQCAPEFIRKIEFPIWGKTFSAGGGKTGSSAGFGVRGDVVINISNPTCSFSIVPPYKSKSTTYADVSVTSNGYFGVRALAQAARDFGITFSDKYDKYKDYTLDLKEVSKLGDDEKKYATAVVEKILEEVNDNEKVIERLQEKLVGGFVEPLLSSSVLEKELTNIQNRLIDELSRNVKKLCSEMEKRSGMTNSARLVCWATLPQPEAIEIARKFGVGVGPGSLPIEPPRPGDVIKTGCSEDTARRIITGIATGGASEAPEIREAKKRFCNWLNEKKEWLTTIDEAYSRYANPEPSIIQDIAKKFLTGLIKLPANIVDTKALARKLLDLAWQVEGGLSNVNEWLDTVLQPADLLKNLKFSVKSSAKAEFNSQAYIIETRPSFQLESNLVFPDKKPALHLKGSSYENGPGSSKGRVGGLEPLNITLSAKLDAYLGENRIFSPPEINLPIKTIERIGVLKKLSSDEKVLTNETVPLSFN